MVGQRRCLRVGLAAVLALVAAAPLAAQSLTPPPPGPFVIDVRGVTLSVPQIGIYYPPMPTGTHIPSRGFGLLAGAEILPFGFSAKRIGIGGEFFVTRATATTPRAAPPTSVTTTSDSTSSSFVPSFPDVRMTMRGVSPQLSVNFGTARGWSYLTVGAGPVRMKTETAGEGAGTVITTKIAPNGGAGARWFVNEHLGVGFDLRLRQFGNRPLFSAAVGFSLK